MQQPSEQQCAQDQVVPVDGTVCRCPDGVTLSFLIEYDKLTRPDLFSTEKPLRAGQTRPEEGQTNSTTIKRSGELKLVIDFENPKLPEGGKAPLLASVDVGMFFKDGFNPEKCCVSALVRLHHAWAAVQSYTNRGRPDEVMETGLITLDPSIIVGDWCENELVCVKSFEWPFQKSFSFGLFGLDLDAEVNGTISLVVEVRR